MTPLATPQVAALVALACAGALVGAVIARRRRLRALLAMPLLPEWRALLACRVPLYARLPATLRAQLEAPIRAFLQRVAFIGCDGLAVSDEMRLVIAAQAALLIVNRDPRSYAGLFSVVIYPDEFVVTEEDIDDIGVVTEGKRALSGQTIATDRIVLSWRDVQERGPPGDAYNVVLHEFAHFLDHAEDGGLASRAADGNRRTAGALARWHDVLEREYARLCAAVDGGAETLIDPYGSEDPAEFFAVATETFFELPQALRMRHPQLYAALQGFYRLDPAGWSEL
ncbi:MAG TPA: M90 family metallopeptidase [Steroidobacteraceae bacterium]